MTSPLGDREFRPIIVESAYDYATVPRPILTPAWPRSRPGQVRIPLGVALLSAALTALLAILLVPPPGLEGAALSTFAIGLLRA